MDKLNVLLVDDEPEILNVFRSVLLKTDQYDVFTCENGQQAINFLNQTEFDIIVSDMKMPGETSGLDILEYVKEKQLPSKFIMQTGFATIDLAIRSMKSGAYDFITKPVNLNHFIALIEKCRHTIVTEKENSFLRSDNERLEELNRVKEKFITITNHELRTPLTILKGYTDLLQMYTKNIESEEIHQGLETIQDTLNDFEYIVTRMHTATKLTKSKQPIVHKRIVLYGLLCDVIHQFQVIVKERSLKLNIINEASDIAIHNDLFLLRKALREVVQNAIRFTPNRGTINIKLDSDGDVARISVQDSGVGISKEHQQYIFDMFYEGQDILNHSTSQSQFLGSSLGIGLYIVKEISEKCHFQIKCESSKARGTLFQFVFPLS